MSTQKQKTADLTEAEIAQIENLIKTDITSYRKMDIITTMCQFQATLSLLYDSYKTNIVMKEQQKPVELIKVNDKKISSETIAEIAELKARAAKLNMELFDLRHEKEETKKKIITLEKELAASKRLANDFRDQANELRDILASEFRAAEEADERAFFENRNKNSFNMSGVEGLAGSIDQGSLVSSFTGSNPMSYSNSGNKMTESMLSSAINENEKKNKVNYINNYSKFIGQGNHTEMMCGSMNPSMMKSRASMDRGLTESELDSSPYTTGSGNSGRELYQNSGLGMMINQAPRFIAGSCAATPSAFGYHTSSEINYNNGRPQYQPQQQMRVMTNYPMKNNNNRIVCGSHVETNPFAIGETSSTSSGLSRQFINNAASPIKIQSKLSPINKGVNINPFVQTNFDDESSDED